MNTIQNEKFVTSSDSENVKQCKIFLILAEPHLIKTNMGRERPWEKCNQQKI